MFQLRCSVLTAVILTIALPALAFADVIVTSALRTTSACAHVFASVSCDQSTQTGTGPYASALSENQVGIGVANATATQTGEVAAAVAGVTEFRGTGEGSGSVVFNVGQAGSTSASGASGFLVWFTLTEAYAYVLDGEFAG